MMTILTNDQLPPQLEPNYNPCKKLIELLAKGNLTDDEQALKDQLLKIKESMDQCDAERETRHIRLVGKRKNFIPIVNSLQSGYLKCRSGSCFDFDSKPISTWEWTGLMSEPRHIAATTIEGYWISTVWIGIDHGFFGNDPIIFEIMIFVQDQPEIEEFLGYQERYSTKEGAAEGHKRAIKFVKKVLKKKKNEI